MVSKITLFEPHIEGAQFGPASLDTPGDIAKVTEPTVGTGSEVTAESSPSRFPKVRAALLVLPLAAAVLGGAMAWRRFRSGRRLDDQATDSTEPATIEERIPTSASSE